jgi:signal peptidase II
VTVVVADQITKAGAVATLTGQPPLQILGTFLQFTLVYNEGGAMGTRLGTSTYYVVMAVIVLPVLAIYIYRTRMQPLLSLPLSFVAAGALGNLIDRIYLGKVVDFIDVDFFDIDLWGFQMDRFWIFNIADSAISCAIVFLLVYTLFFQPPVKADTADSGITAPPPA